MANTAVFGIYPSTDGVESAVGELRNQGFRSTDISVLWPQNLGSKDLAHERATKAPEGASAGAGSGAMVGATLGWLVGIGAAGRSRARSARRRRPHRGLARGAGAGGVIGGLIGAVVGIRHSGVRGEALRGPPPQGRHPAVSPRRRRQMDEARQAGASSARALSTSRRSAKSKATSPTANDRRR